MCDGSCALQHAATHCNTLQHTATHCNTLQHTATHCNALQQSATHRNTRQQSATQHHTATHCSTLKSPCLDDVRWQYGVALVSRIDTIIGLFCKRALQKRQYSAKETCNFIDPTDCSHPIVMAAVMAVVMVYMICVTYIWVCLYSRQHPLSHTPRSLCFDDV